MDRLTLREVVILVMLFELELREAAPTRAFFVMYEPVLRRPPRLALLRHDHLWLWSSLEPEELYYAVLKYENPPKFLLDVASLNVYNVLGPCYNGTVALDTIIRNTKLSSSFRKFSETERPLPMRKRTFGCARPFKGKVRDGIVPTWPQILNSEEVTCFDDEVATLWLNTESVRKAIHAEQGRFEYLKIYML
ncbi:hypothetical protein Vadar_029006 [Vaccinium darrowii]|uniref:Uncharacterized protein n=1 Tax=Vaccinium darrowii TaxID=229202 RepID=A0ACB7XUP6_9ERIC|nr:hypothetical protein Vadar_029006 [Vaccinium darrowii]